MTSQCRMSTGSQVMEDQSKFMCGNAMWSQPPVFPFEKWVLVARFPATLDSLVSIT
jgi:hypothetical protein